VPDGTVEMLAQGRPEDIDDCIQDIKEYFAGYLRETRIEEIPPDPRYIDFKITF
jgi:acylphosphatase